MNFLVSDHGREAVDARAKCAVLRGATITVMFGDQVLREIFDGVQRVFVQWLVGKLRSVV